MSDNFSEKRYWKKEAKTESVINEQFTTSYKKKIINNRPKNICTFRLFTLFASLSHPILKLDTSGKCMIFMMSGRIWSHTALSTQNLLVLLIEF